MADNGVGPAPVDPTRVEPAPVEPTRKGMPSAEEITLRKKDGPYFVGRSPTRANRSSPS